MSDWSELHDALRTLSRSLSGVGYVLADAGMLQFSPPHPLASEVRQRLDRAWDSLLLVFGPDSPRRARWKRHLHHEPDNWFVAQPLLGGYQLIIVLMADHFADETTAHTLLDQARPELERIITDLPPLDGNDANAGAGRLR